MSVDKKRLGTKRLRSLWDKTTAAYNKVRDAVLEEHYPGRKYSDPVSDLSGSEVFERNHAAKSDPVINDEIGKRYLDELCSLPTEDIEDIIKASVARMQKRAPLTIEALMNELTRRGLLGDSQEL